MAILSLHKRRLVSFRRRLPSKRFGMKSTSYFPRRIAVISKGQASLYKVRENRIRSFKWKMADPTQYMRSWNILSHVRSLRWKKQKVEKYRARRKRFTSSINKKKKKGWDTRNSKYMHSRNFLDPWFWEKRKELKKMWEGWHEHAWKKERQKSWIRAYEEEGYIRSMGLKGNLYVRDPWGGDRSKSRNYRWYGPAGPQNRALVWSVHVDTKKLKDLAKHNTVRADRYARIIQDELQVSKANVLEKAKKFITTYVPSDTGRLRLTMLNRLSQAVVTKYTFTMYIDTGNLKYAKPVNNMPTRMLQHDSIERRRSRGWYEDGRFISNPYKAHYGFNAAGVKNNQPNFMPDVLASQRYLHDPHAVKSWWGFSVMECRKYAREEFQDLITRLQDRFTRKTARIVKDKLKQTTPQAKRSREYRDLTKVTKALTLAEELDKAIETRKEVWNEIITGAGQGQNRDVPERIMTLPFTHEDRLNEWEKFEKNFIDEFKEKAKKRGTTVDEYFKKSSNRIKAMKTFNKELGGNVPYYYFLYYRWIWHHWNDGTNPWEHNFYLKQKAMEQQQMWRAYKEDILTHEEELHELKMADMRNKWGAREITKTMQPSRLEIRSLLHVKFK